jgi:hypothetical protein
MRQRKSTVDVRSRILPQLRFIAGYVFRRFVNQMAAGPQEQPEA